MYVITCDYLPGNPGHAYAHEYHNVSTTDREGVLALAKSLRIDAIVAYASDPSVPAAAYVAEQLGLPGNPCGAIETLAYKDRFREFVSGIGMNSPRCRAFREWAEFSNGLKEFHLPVMVKPVDSSGSKGVTRLDMASHTRSAFDAAMANSRVKAIVVEEFVDKVGPQIHGDAFVIDGKITFACLGDHRFATYDQCCVPIATSIPSTHPDEIIKRVVGDAETIVSQAGYRNGPINIEAMVDGHGRVYVMEIGPRNGGNFVPQLVQHATGVDMVEWNLHVALGQAVRVQNSEVVQSHGYYSYFIIHSDADGLFRDVQVSEQVTPKILERHLFKRQGDAVRRFTGSNCTIGVLLLRYLSLSDMSTMLDSMQDHVRVRLLGGRCAAVRSPKL